MSVKTARRDLEALAIAGIPVYSQSGKNGGWSLVGGARTDLSGLTADEARALFLLAGPSAALTADAKAALRKLVSGAPGDVPLGGGSGGGGDRPRPGDVGRPPTRATASPRRAAAGGRRRAAGAPRVLRPHPHPDASGPSTPSASSRRARCGTSSPERRPGCGRSGSAGCSRSRSPTSQWSDQPTSTSPPRGRRSWRRSRNGGPPFAPPCGSTPSRPGAPGAVRDRLHVGRRARRRPVRGRDRRPIPEHDRRATRRMGRPRGGGEPTGGPRRYWRESGANS